MQEVPGWGSTSWAIFAHLARSGYWARFDDDLCKLVDRLNAKEYHHIRSLEVEVRVRTKGDDGRWCLTEIFPEFREKGVVTIWSDQVLVHSSAHNR